VMPRKAEFPEVGDLVICSVQNVKNFGAFVTLDEFSSKEGFIHVRDVATGWVKYIRDHVREGQKVVCKVLGVDRDKGHIDLSLKQVNEHQKREKIQEFKNEKKAEKLLEIVGGKLKKTYDEVGDTLLDEFGTLYAAFESAVADPKALEEVGVDKKWARAVSEVAGENIQLPSVMVDGTLEMSTPAPDGVDHIREALSAGLGSKSADVKIHYLGAPRYRITVTAEDYKVAESELKQAVEAISKEIERTGGSAVFKRNEAP
jgi:translation initiation factor 2 subunit 1